MLTCHVESHKGFNFKKTTELCPSIGVITLYPLPSLSCIFTKLVSESTWFKWGDNDKSVSFVRVF